MLDLKFIRQNPKAVEQATREKGEVLDLDQLLALDANVIKLKNELQQLQTQRNAHSKKIPKADASKRPGLIAEGRQIGEKIDQLRPQLIDMQAKLQELLYTVPAIPHPDAPRGAGEEDNVEVKRVGTIPRFDFEARDHVAILQAGGHAEFERIARVCGSRSYSLRNDMIRLEMAMHQLALSKLASKGFTLLSLPSLVRREALYGTGHFPQGRDQVYHLEKDDLFLSGTSEVQINSLHAGEILAENDLPLLYAGYSSCFRREAGSHGKDVRGLIRVHQFTKVEQYILCKNDPEESARMHNVLLETSEDIVADLELPYRVVECCTGDMGTGKVRMYDLECWVPSEGRYRETHSCSALHDWQARRTNTRYRDAQGALHFVHTLNNTAIATPRILASFLECHQQADASIGIPPALGKLMGGVERLGGS